ncbi:XPG domain containing-domain-containing protein [Aspergillus floccosus]
MGIPHLSRHLMPFSETIVLEGRRNLQLDDVTYTSSIVIDGPSLVYHVYGRLLSQANLNLEYPDIQPTCDEVSCAVMFFLLQLALVNVKIESICFDGALPTQKRETRLSRLEKGRRRLENFRSKAKAGFKGIQSPVQAHTLNPRHLFSSRPLPAKFKDLPENPFMVPTVFEDLKTRWNRENILDVSKDVICTQSLTLDDFPWADITVMVPGEADIYCAHVAKATDCAVLSNDSDLLLHNLGMKGSAVLFNSIEMISRGTITQITAVRLSPALIANRLGVPDLLSLAYELKTCPDMSLVELIRQSKQDRSGSEAEYRSFVEEYCSNDSSHSLIPQTLQCLDTRISELFCQYESRMVGASEEAPHVYLPILVEDHARRSAWMQGRSSRIIAYSMLNASRPKSERCSHINEFVRRGGRITVDSIPMGNNGWIASEMASLRDRLLSTQERFQLDFETEAYWRTFALCEVLAEASSNNFPNYRQLGRFLALGRTGDGLEWADIHLAAQIQSTLYSLRILKQLLQLAGTADETVAQVKSILLGLPALHIMMKSTRQMTEDLVSQSSISEFLGLFFGEEKPEASDGHTQSENTSRSRNSHPQDRSNTTVNKDRRNLYELLALD